MCHEGEQVVRKTATSASAVTAPSLLANISTGPAPSSSIIGAHVARLDRGRMVVRPLGGCCDRARAGHT